MKIKEMFMVCQKQAIYFKIASKHENNYMAYYGLLFQKI